MLKVQRVSRALMLGALLATTCLSTSANGAPEELAPQTKLRLTVVQFVPSTGDYQRWDALGGDVEVAADGTVMVPTLGTIAVAGLGPEQLGAEIARRLKLKLGLLEAPDASIQVVEYPPVYVVGNVTNPGQYAFRPGMTVIHALALAGGENQIETATSLSGTIRLETDLNGLGSDILRSTARLARLDSEFAGRGEIEFPAELDANDPRIADILEQERRIFTARINGYERQQAGLTQLAQLFEAQIDTLDQKAHALEEQTARAQQQVDAISKLVAAGSATVSRLSDAERILADLRSDRLDNLLATMSARQNLNNAGRDLARLEDDHTAEVSIQLQTEQAALERLLLNQDATTRLLRQSVEFDRNLKLAGAMRISLNYAIMRQQNGQPATLDATEVSTLMPGDLVKVTMQIEPPTSSATAAVLGGSGAGSN
ncbi:MAG: polysaccharide biosynthesis/export family protein [Alphaproteobacteria bacterium]|nr:polysaccharide biosynthesis/export family protein [Alphaproteobacteria bacterium]MBU1561613.1 polysaccharide biosynthesis/export family protein [Alphaproteobacteria bacterium]MBU2302406.1 polysaccharide biosynthesis/export family protein [Alphaproteobacteria bacterium]MBU2368686.1 polysaccharide biosynthesis/export family protein [Alphaproteobacteria bacterium]